MSETLLKVHIVRALEREFPKGHFWRTSGGPYAAPGVPDILGVIDGYAFGIEAKVNARKYGATPTQLAFGKKMIAAGGCWLLADDPAETVRLVRDWLRVKVQDKPAQNGDDSGDKSDDARNASENLAGKLF